MTKTAKIVALREKGLKYHEIAARVGSTKNSVGVLLHQYRKKQEKAQAGSEAWWKARGY